MAILEKEADEIRQEMTNAEAERKRAKEDLGIIESRFRDLQNAQQELVRGNDEETKKLWQSCMQHRTI
jgi:hypothetical protein